MSQLEGTSDHLMGPSRSTRDRARLAALVNPRELFSRMRNHWQTAVDCCKSSVYSLVSTKQTLHWCTGILASVDLAQMTAHVIGCHGGNVLLQPGLRYAAVQENKGYRKKEKIAKDRMMIRRSEVSHSLQSKQMHILDEIWHKLNRTNSKLNINPMLLNKKMQFGKAPSHLRFDLEHQQKEFMVSFKQRCSLSATLWARYICYLRIIIYSYIWFNYLIDSI